MRGLASNARFDKQRYLLKTHSFIFSVAVYGVNKYDEQSCLGKKARQIGIRNKKEERKDIRKPK